MAAPAIFTDEGVSFVDLVLDVVRMPDRAVMMLDEDEIELYVAKWSISLDAVANARAVCDQVAQMLREGIEPFGEVWARWLGSFERGRSHG
jgi:predicted RNA-binding protein associated with RNAse of E/G family